MPHCNVIRDLLPLHIDGLTSEESENMLKEHLSVCKDCAAVYGIEAPSMILYGPAGCGKTFFAEKLAEELGIHFMKLAFLMM